ncbi:MAG: hypothetical protein ACOYJA_11300 [Christensenellales bacterium]
MTGYDHLLGMPLADALAALGKQPYRLVTTRDPKGKPGLARVIAVRRQGALLELVNGAFPTLAGQEPESPRSD